MVNQNQRDLLTRLYESPRLPNSFGGIDTLYKRAKLVDKTITRKVIKDFLASESSYTLHKITQKKFTRRKVISSRPKVIASCDLADFTLLSRYNNGHKYILVVIDVFSRFVQVAPIKRKDGISVLEALKPILESNYFKGINRLNSDNGKEFYNRHVKNYLSEKSIKLYSVSSFEIKASIAERVIQTLKRKLYKYMTHNNTFKYLNVLPKIIESYNNTPHRSLRKGQTPSQVHALTNYEDIKKQFYRMYNKARPTETSISRLLTVGQTVRIADSKRNSIFRRGFTIQNTYEIFKVREINNSQNPTVYYLEDLQGEQIEGIFYRQELIPTKLPEFYHIDVIKTRKVKGRTKYLVKWRGYPDEFNSWIDESNLIQI